MELTYSPHLPKLMRLPQNTPTSTPGALWLFTLTVLSVLLFPVAFVASMVWTLADAPRRC